MFNERLPSRDASSPAHLARMIAMLGPPPLELLSRGNLSHEFFDEKGKLKPFLPIYTAEMLTAGRQLHSRCRNSCEVVRGTRGSSRGRREGSVFKVPAEDVAVGTGRQEIGQGAHGRRMATDRIINDPLKSSVPIISPYTPQSEQSTSEAE